MRSRQFAGCPVRAGASGQYQSLKEANRPRGSENPIRARSGLANLSAPSQGLKSEAPDPAATGSSAKIAHLTSGHDGHTGRPIEEQRISDAENEARICFYFNEGWDGAGWEPYALLAVGECVFATRQTERGNRHPDGAADAEDFRTIMLKEARRRYLAGFYANPFTKNPKRRPCATGGSSLV